MKKIIYMTLLAIGISSVAYGQVGVNTEAPQQTLDVNGTMRIDDLGTPSPNSIPLTWVPKENANDTKFGQIVKGSDAENTPMRYLTYRVKMKGSSDYAYSANLKIDSNKYIAILSQAYLVKEMEGNHKIADSQVFVKLITKKINDDNSVIPVKIGASTYGNWVDKNGNEFIEDKNTENNKFILGVSQPEVGLKIDENGYYNFYGDYWNTGALDDEGPYTWVVNVLVIKKSLVKITGFN